MKCSLYRHFDEHGVLLYVGITDSPHSRARDHALASEWVQYASAGTIEWFDTREEAEAAELRAIRNERPVWNVVGAGAREDVEARVYAYRVGRDATVRALATHRRCQARDELARRRGQMSTVGGLVTLADYAERAGLTVKTLRNGRDRDPAFPEPVGVGARNASVYALDDLNAWNEARTKATVS